MKTILAMGGGTSGFSTASSSFFLPLGMSSPPDALTESVDWQYHRVARAGVLTNLRAYSQIYTRSTPTTATLWVNGVATALVASLTAAGWAVDSTHSVTVNPGDLVCVRIATGTGSGSVFLRQLACDFEALDGSITQWLGGRSTATAATPTTSNNNGVRYNSILGLPALIWSVATVGRTTRMPQAGSLSGLTVYVPANTLSEDLTVEWTGSAATSPKLVIPAGASGRFTVAGSMAFAQGDLICLQQSTVSGAPTGAIGIARTSMEVSWAANYILATYSSSPPNGLTNNAPYVGGHLNSWDTETLRQFLMSSAATAVALHTYNVTAAPVGQLEHLRKNAVDTGASIAPAAAAGAWINATGFSVAYAPGDLLSIRNVAGASSTNGIGQILIEFQAAGVVVVEVNTSPGALRVTGSTPTVLVEELVFTTPGSLIVTGGLPSISATEIVDVPGGDLILEGQQVALSVGSSVVPGRGVLVLEGGVPAIFTDFAAIVPQLATLALAVPPPPPVRASQQAVLAAGYVIPPVAVSQQAVLILVDGSPCVTERCQLWRIKRRDGVEFRYTSLDRDVRYGGQVYKSCGSLNPSASEDASTLGTVSNIELEGIISDDGITEADLYGGLFDDAYVTVDLVAWGALPESPRRLASGWTGELSQGDTGFKMEVLGAGSRLDQQALVQMVTPGCRWVFGDARCGIDLEGLKIAGTVTGSVSRSVFGAALAGDGAGRQWENGSVRFTSGPNEGQRLEVRSVDFGDGVINLWPSAAFRADPGDTFDLYPGCDKARDGGCSLYANVINHGGFPDVPGNDSILETPDAQY